MFLTFQVYQFQSILALMIHHSRIPYIYYVFWFLDYNRLIFLILSSSFCFGAYYKILQICPYIVTSYIHTYNHFNLSLCNRSIRPSINISFGKGNNSPFFAFSLIIIAPKTIISASVAPFSLNLITTDLSGLVFFPVLDHLG